MSAIVFNNISFDDHEQISFVSEPKSRLRAIVAVHNSQRGPAMGGCRMWNYSSETQALNDVLRLSRGMTYKNAVAGLPIGGGKCVIMGDPQQDKSPAIFEALGEAIERMGGLYITAEDVGTTPDDMAHVSKQTQYVAGLGPNGDPSPYTALGCFVGARAAIKHHLHRDSFEGLTVAVQGLGNVGYDYARRLHKAGAKLIVADIDVNALERARNELNAKIVSVDAIYDVDADIYAPCALGGTVNAGTLARLKVKIIAGGANNQLATSEMNSLARQKGILYVPDFVINAGGIMKACYEYFNKAESEVEDRVLKIENTLLGIFELADQKSSETSFIAEEIARASLKN